MRYQVIVISDDARAIEVQTFRHIEETLLCYKRALAEKKKAFAFDLCAFNNDGSSVKLAPGGSLLFEK